MKCKKLFELLHLSYIYISGILIRCGLFAQLRNIFSMSFIKFLLDVALHQFQACLVQFFQQSQHSTQNILISTRSIFLRTHGRWLQHWLMLLLRLRVLLLLLLLCGLSRLICYSTLRKNFRRLRAQVALTLSLPWWTISSWWLNARSTWLVWSPTRNILLRWGSLSACSLRAGKMRFTLRIVVLRLFYELRLIGTVSILCGLRIEQLVVAVLRAAGVIVFRDGCIVQLGQVWQRFDDESAVVGVRADRVVPKPQNFDRQCLQILNVSQIVNCILAQVQLCQFSRWLKCGQSSDFIERQWADFQVGHVLDNRDVF